MDACMCDGKTIIQLNQFESDTIMLKDQEMKQSLLDDIYLLAEDMFSDQNLTTIAIHIDLGIAYGVLRKDGPNCNWEN